MRPKDFERNVAEELRRQGWTCDELSDLLFVSKSSLSNWLRHLPPPTEEQRVGRGRSPDEMRAMGRARWDRTLAARQEEREITMSAAAGTVAAISDRELELIAVTAYWCEGSKSKPYARREQVKFVNSDPGLVLIFLEYLRRMGFHWSDLYMNVAIHENADVEGAERWWAALIGTDAQNFAKPTLKRHRPLTKRKNTADRYVGCFYVSVRGSRLLYQHIEGVWRGITAGWSTGSTATGAAE